MWAQIAGGRRGERVFWFWRSHPKSLSISGFIRAVVFNPRPWTEGVLGEAVGCMAAGDLTRWDRKTLEVVWAKGSVCLLMPMSSEGGLRASCHRAVYVDIYTHNIFLCILYIIHTFEMGTRTPWDRYSTVCVTTPCCRHGHFKEKKTSLFKNNNNALFVCQCWQQQDWLRVFWHPQHWPPALASMNCPES